MRVKLVECIAMDIDETIDISVPVSSPWRHAHIPLLVTFYSDAIRYAYFASRVNGFTLYEYAVIIALLQYDWRARWCLGTHENNNRNRNKAQTFTLIASCIHLTWTATTESTSIDILLNSIMKWERNRWTITICMCFLQHSSICYCYCLCCRSLFVCEA